MKSLAEDIMTYVAGNTSLVIGTDLFAGDMHDGPDAEHAAVVLRDSGGFEPDPTNQDISEDTFQVFVRGQKGGYREAYAQAEALFALLHKLTNETIGTTRYVFIFAMQRPIYLGMDDNQRPEFSINFRTMRTA
jgi:hypothetical protein